MHKLIALLVVIGTLAAGCVGDPGGPLYVDSRFSAEERADIQAAADMWTAAGAPVDLVWDAKVTGRSTDRRELVRARGHREAVALNSLFLQPGYDGVEKDGTLVIDMERMAEEGDTLRPLVAHEMGHMLGLKHVGTSGTALMSDYRDIASPVELTAIDLTECRRAGAGCVAREEAQVSP